MSGAKLTQVINGIRARGEYTVADYGLLRDAIGKRGDDAERALLEALNTDMKDGRIAVRGLALLPPLPKPWAWSVMVLNAVAAPFMAIFAKASDNKNASAATIGAAVLFGATATVALAPLTFIAATLVTAYQNLRD
jgi:hypothetical protein